MQIRLVSPPRHSWETTTVPVDGGFVCVCVCRWCGLMSTMERTWRGGLGPCPGERPAAPLDQGGWYWISNARLPWAAISR